MATLPPGDPGGEDPPPNIDLTNLRSVQPAAAPVTASISTVDLTGAREALPSSAPVRRTPMSELEQAAVWLAAGVLAMILSVMAAVLVFAAMGEFSTVQAEIANLQKALDAATQSYITSKTPEALDRVNQMALRIRELRQDARKVWFDFAQLLLVNVLLPVLTSILGYVFGTMRATKPEEK